MAKSEPAPLFFATPAEFRVWLQAHHAIAAEQWVGFYKVGSRRPSITWPESVDEALCVGWIDGLRKRIDQASYKIRFTPRKRGSIWSAVNMARVAELTRSGRMQPAGLAAFVARRERSLPSMPMNSGKTPRWMRRQRRSSGATRPPGISSARSRRGTSGPRVGG